MKKKRLSRAAAVISIVIICVIDIVIRNQDRAPKLVGCIVSMDTAYMTVLAERWELSEEEELRAEVWKLCREKEARRFHVSVYLTQEDLEAGERAIVMEY